MHVIIRLKKRSTVKPNNHLHYIIILCGFMFDFDFLHLSSPKFKNILNEKLRNLIYSVILIYSCHFTQL